MDFKIKYYSGVGSRSCPSDILKLIYNIGKELAEKNFILRSGAAEGCDTAFETGCDEGQGNKEIYLPWKGFNNNPSSLYNVSNEAEALKMAAAIHPNWKACSSGAQALHARNCYQVLGLDLKTPSEFVVCYTDGGTPKGGTRTSIILAEQHNIPVINLGDSTVLNRVQSYNSFKEYLNEMD